MSKALRFETTNTLPANVAARVKDVTEHDARVSPRPERDVYLVARLYGRGTFLFATGAMLVVIVLANHLYVLNGEQRFTLIGIALGLACASSAAVYLLILRRQLAWYKAQVARTRRYGLAVGDEPGKREFQRTAANPNVRRASSYDKWTEKKKRQLARQLVNEDGDWIGGERFTRKYIEPVIENYSENWPLITTDFEAWGWIVNAGTEESPIWLWTAYGRHMIMGWWMIPDSKRAM